MTRLYWSADWLVGQQLLAWVDDAHPTPVVFRWKEALAIANHLQDETTYRPYPNQPSLVLLLLSPFIAVTSFDNVADIEGRFHDQVRQLDLLQEDEVAEAVQRLLPSPGSRTDTANFVPFEWKADKRVGWQQHGGVHMRGGDEDVFLGNHSTRHSSNVEFPATEFIEYLRSVGIDDL